MTLHFVSASPRERPRRSVPLRQRKSAAPKPLRFGSRYHWLLGLFLCGFGVLMLRLGYLQVMHREFLQQQGNARLQRTVTLPAHRGMLLDRNGEALAISTPVESVWVNPQEITKARSRWPELAHLLELPAHALDKLLQGRMQREFVYLKRHLNPDVVSKVTDLDLPGVFMQREYRRYYPAAEVTAHVLGFTNVDDVGQEGLELALEHYLQGVPGSQRVIQDQHGRVLANVDEPQQAKAGRDVYLSLDRRLAYLAYRELATAVNAHHARSGSLAVVDARTGEVLALTNQPAYNPNDRDDRVSAHYRNRAVTDVFEPGSTIKPFTVAAALDSGVYNLNTLINTHPGSVRVGRYTVRDSHNYGTINLATVLQKSSNVGASKIAMSLNADVLWNVFSDVGFGMVVGSGFPGEVSGSLEPYQDWSSTKQASLGFGYGLNVTLLQLAQAYTVLANDGKLVPLRFTRYEPATGDSLTVSHQAMSVETARKVRDMLKAVVSPGGTGNRAQVANYRVAGKTGTVHKAERGGYAAKRYLSLFAGMAPADNPRLVVVVVIDEPGGDTYYGGEVAAPVFSKVMAGALRLLNVPPDL